MSAQPEEHPRGFEFCCLLEWSFQFNGFVSRVWTHCFSLCFLTSKLNYSAEERPARSTTAYHHCHRSPALSPHLIHPSLSPTHLSSSSMTFMAAANSDIHLLSFCTCPNCSQSDFISTTSNMHCPSDVLHRDPGPFCSRNAQLSATCSSPSCLTDMFCDPFGQNSVCHCRLTKCALQPNSSLSSPTDINSSRWCCRLSSWLVRDQQRSNWATHCWDADCSFSWKTKKGGKRCSVTAPWRRRSKAALKYTVFLSPT